MSEQREETEEESSCLLGADAGTIGLELCRVILSEEDELCGHARAREGHHPRRVRGF